MSLFQTHIHKHIDTIRRLKNEAHELHKTVEASPDITARRAAVASLEQNEKQAVDTLMELGAEVVINFVGSFNSIALSLETLAHNDTLRARRDGIFNPS